MKDDLSLADLQKLPLLCPFVLHKRECQSGVLLSKARRRYISVVGVDGDGRAERQGALLGSSLQAVADRLGRYGGRIASAEGADRVEQRRMRKVGVQRGERQAGEKRRPMEQVTGSRSGVEECCDPDLSARVERRMEDVQMVEDLWSRKARRPS